MGLTARCGGSLALSARALGTNAFSQTLMLASSVSIVWLVGHELALLKFRIERLVTVDAVLDLVAETSNQTLDGPSGGVAQSTDGVTFDLVGEFLKHVDFSEVGIALLHAFEHIDHPGGALAAGSALTATLVLVEFGEAEDGVDYVGLVVHNDDGCSAETGSAFFQVIKVHDSFITLLLGKHGYGRAARNDSLQVVPTTNDTAGMSVDQLTERNTHFFFDGDGVVNVATDAEKLGASVFGASEVSEPIATAAHDSGAHTDCLDVSDSGGAPVETRVGWKWGL